MFPSMSPKHNDCKQRGNVQPRKYYMNFSFNFDAYIRRSIRIKRGKLLSGPRLEERSVLFGSFLSVGISRQVYYSREKFQSGSTMAV